MLAGVSDHVYHQLQKTGLLDQLGKDNVYRGTSILGDSTQKAYEDAIMWLKQGQVQHVGDAVVTTEDGDVEVEGRAPSTRSVP